MNQYLFSPVAPHLSKSGSWKNVKGKDSSATNLAWVTYQPKASPWCFNPGRGKRLPTYSKL